MFFTCDDAVIKFPIDFASSFDLWNLSEHDLFSSTRLPSSTISSYTAVYRYQFLLHPLDDR